MKNQLLVVRQLDKKIQKFSGLDLFHPSEGWINLIRTTLQMSLQQLGKRLSVTPQNIKRMEAGEKEGTITLNSLRQAAEALNMKVVYAFMPLDGSLEKTIELRARELATKVVMRTSTTMKLEDQENSKTRLKEAIDEMTVELKKEMSKKLWD